MREEPKSLTLMRENIMRSEIEKVLEAMREDYMRWSNSCARPDSYEGYSDVKKEMEKDYCEGLEVTEGNRYWKIISDKRGSRSVCGFIAKAGDKKFREGDMLKAAGWAAPARNFARGNVLDGTGVNNVRWTGIG
jgi:hypothetical protein